MAADRGLADRITTVNRSMAELPYPDESFDLVWAEGSIYNIGFDRALRLWRRLIAPGVEQAGPLRDIAAAWADPRAPPVGVLTSLEVALVDVAAPVQARDALRGARVAVQRAVSIAQRGTAHTVPVRIGASRDPVEILHLGYPNLNMSCLDCVSGRQRADAQSYVLHPRVVVLYAWERTADGGRGARLARLAVYASEQGILVLNSPHTSGDLDFGAAFADYLRDWEARTGRPVLTVTEQGRWYHPDQLPTPAGAITEVMSIALQPAPDVPSLWADIFDVDPATRLPVPITQVVRRWSGIGLGGRIGAVLNRVPDRVLAAPVAAIGAVRRAGAWVAWLGRGVVARLSPPLAPVARDWVASSVRAAGGLASVGAIARERGWSGRDVLAVVANTGRLDRSGDLQLHVYRGRFGRRWIWAGRPGYRSPGGEPVVGPHVEGRSSAAAGAPAEPGRRDAVDRDPALAVRVVGQAPHDRPHLGTEWRTGPGRRPGVLSRSVRRRARAGRAARSAGPAPAGRGDRDRPRGIAAHPPQRRGAHPHAEPVARHRPASVRLLAPCPTSDPAADRPDRPDRTGPEQPAARRTQAPGRPGRSVPPALGGSASIAFAAAVGAVRVAVLTLGVGWAVLPEGMRLGVAAAAVLLGAREGIRRLRAARTVPAAIRGGHTGKLRLEYLTSKTGHGPRYQVYLGDQLVAIYKPARWWRRWSAAEPVREIATYIVADELGWAELVASTFAWHGPWGRGSVQLWVDDVPDGPISVDPTRDQRRAGVLDYVIANLDRIHDNYKAGRRGALRLIDNGEAFPTRPLLPWAALGIALYGVDSGNKIRQPFTTEIALRGTAIGEDVLADVAAVDLRRLGKRLRNAGLSRRAVASTLARIRTVQRTRTITREMLVAQHRKPW